jgi:HD-GYP domain-containing protein (c-di-GMP phosphodiesterase class II)
LMARIIAVADTFDAISSNRAYRSARPKSEALEIVLDAAGTQLDPDLVRVSKPMLQRIVAEETT